MKITLGYPDLPTHDRIKVEAQLSAHFKHIALFHKPRVFAKLRIEVKYFESLSLAIEGSDIVVLLDLDDESGMIPVSWTNYFSEYGLLKDCDPAFPHDYVRKGIDTGLHSAGVRGIINYFSLGNEVQASFSNTLRGAPMVHEDKENPWVTQTTLLHLLTTKTTLASQVGRF